MNWLEMNWLELVAWVVVLPLAVPLLVLAVECFAALGRQSGSVPPDPEPRPRVAVLVPAHDEAAGIGRTLAAVLAQLGPDDRVLVVADNCTDDTATVARDLGADVVVRTDPLRRGKGYALAFGREALRADPPDVVVVLDADCTLGDQALCRVAARAGSGRPAQMTNRLSAPEAAGADRKVGAFAFLVKNYVRPLGLSRLGFPCLLTGTGMAMPWALFRTAKLSHGHIAEDLNLAIDLARDGQTAAFVAEATIWGEFPVNPAAAAAQRRRWEHGHLKVILSGVPRLVAAAVRRRRLDLFVLALEVAVPPLSALGMAAVAALLLLSGWAAFGGPVGPPVALAVVSAVATAAAFAAWVRYGRGVLPVGTLLRVPVYAVRKIGMYLGFFVRPQREWVRTAREGGAGAETGGA